MGHEIWIIKKVNRIPTHCVVAYESVCPLARGHVIRVCHSTLPFFAAGGLDFPFQLVVRCIIHACAWRSSGHSYTMRLAHIIRPKPQYGVGDPRAVSSM